MQLNSKGLALTLASMFIWFIFPVRLLAQQSQAFQTPDLLPEAPRPQLAMVVTESIAQQVPNIQGQTSHPSSSAVLQQETGSISSTVTDLNGGVVPGATVTLDGSLSSDHHQVKTDDNGGFVFDLLRGNAAYRISVRMKGFVNWTSSDVMLAPGQSLFLPGVSLKVDGEATSVTVYGSTEQIAVEQVHVAEQQRVLGIIPNFYVVYDSKNAVPLTTKLKYKLALRVSVDPVSIAAVTSMAAIKQAADTPDFVQGAKGYGQRVGAIGADSFSDILIGGAVLPSLLHQDPRYFYQGEGSTKSRLRHALFSPFICRGDNGRAQPNYSSLGGDLASSAISNAYYPQSNRGAGLVFGNFAIGTVERMASGFAQEFILRKFTSAAKSGSN
jgi:hypothetical protein